MKKLLFLLLFFIFIYCSKRDKVIGHYVNGKHNNLYIKTAGDNGYFLQFYSAYNEYDNTYYCELKDGCFYRSVNKIEYPLVCFNGNKLIDNRSKIYSKNK